MDRQEAIEFLLDHYQHPRTHGPLADADVTMPGGNPGCGDIVTIYLKVGSSGDQVEKVTFEGEGCTISQAAASILTEMTEGKPFSTIDEMDEQSENDPSRDDLVSNLRRVRRAAREALPPVIRTQAFEPAGAFT